MNIKFLILIILLIQSISSNTDFITCKKCKRQFPTIEVVGDSKEQETDPNEQSVCLLQCKDCALETAQKNSVEGVTKKIILYEIYDPEPEEESENIIGDLVVRVCSTFLKKIREAQKKIENEAKKKDLPCEPEYTVEKKKKNKVTKSKQIKSRGFLAWVKSNIPKRPSFLTKKPTEPEIEKKEKNWKLKAREARLLNRRKHKLKSSIVKEQNLGQVQRAMRKISNFV